MADRREYPQPLLLIDDDAAFSGFIAKGLGRAGLPTTVARTGESGLAALQTGQYSLVLLDLVLPDIDGLEVLRRVRIQRELPSVILLSGLGNIRTAVEAIRLGALDFLEKPLNVQDLVDTVRSHLPVSVPTCGRIQADSALHDLAGWLMVVITAAADTRTIDEWAHQVGTSAPTIFARCAVGGLRAKAILDLGRLLRLALISPSTPSDIVLALRSRDLRTVDALLERAGVSASQLERRKLPQLLAAQQLVVDSRFNDLLLALLVNSRPTLA